MRFSATDHALVSSVGKDILVGKAFAFVGKDAWKKPALAWVSRLLDGDVRARVLSLLGPGSVSLPGATAEPSTFAALDLRSVTSDKALYREGRDEVHLFVLDPLAPHDAAVIEIRQGGVELAKHPIVLDARGAAAITLRDLPAGDYVAGFRDAPKDAPACAFTVAAYRLVPLVAALVDRRLEGSRLAFTLRLESFGSAVDGPVILELTDRGKRLARESAEARGGRVSASFTLSGDGPHAINVQLAADAARTATVPIVGSRAAERSLTTFSTLGYEVRGSLLPSEGSIPVRGIHLAEGAVRSSPFRLDRVDTRVARLTATADVEVARVVVLDPTFPVARAGAVDPARAPHPAGEDERYRRGEALFHAGKFAESRAAFEAALGELAAPHPNYAYYVACCFAREGDRDRAVGALRRAIRDGWKDFDLMRRDDDLAALRGHEPYEALAARGVSEIGIDGARAGQSFEIQLSAPMAVLAIGAYVQGEPWEGWAATIAPADMAPTLDLPERASPGDLARIAIDTGRRGDDVSVYVVVKDARLLTPDTPESRLAGSMKALAERASTELAVGRPSRTLVEVVPPPPPPLPPFSPMPAMPTMMPLGAAPGFGAPLPRAGGPMPVTARPPPAPMAAPAAAGAPARSAPGPYREAAPPPPPAVEEPEVIFAGLVDTRAGRAAISLRLGPDFADYLVEVFAIAGADWASVERRFRAEKEVFASLDLPAFVHPDDGAVARVHVGSRGGASVRVTRDGAAVPLLFDGRALAPSERVPAGRAELSFIAGPGRYEALVEDASGVFDRVARDVAIPGKLRRVARTVRLLEPGQSLSRDADASILGLRVLPGIDGPLTALVDATGDYGHACCEQTAAKMLAACAMFALADDRARRDRAESIILAGVRREASMWLRGRGFKMYPESSPEPTPYWGSKAARHLHNLAMVRDLGPGRALASALDQGLEMADDATRAYGLAWPPKAIASCEDAYSAMRFGGESGAAVSFVRDRVHGVELPAAPANPYHGGAVAQRAEASYASAALFRGGQSSDRARALSLANAVLASIGPEGRLYSTVDSVAAIALAAELSAAKLIGGSGWVEVDGSTLRTADAAKRPDAARVVRSIDAVTAVEVTRIVEEDWGAFGAALPIAVRLKKGDVVTRRIEALDAVDLEVTLEGGYKAGDLLWVCLPDALSRVVGGGQVKQFSVDFEGKNSVTVSLAATGTTVGKRGDPAPARFAVCVRNMFEEERGGSPGYIEVSVAPPAGGGLMAKVMGGLKGLFGG